MDFTRIRDEGEEEADEALEGRRRPGCLLGLLRLALLLGLPALLLAALLPTLLSSEAGRRWALGRANAALAPAQVACDRWRLGWLTPPSLEGVAYTDAARGVAVRVEGVAFERGLLRLLPVGRLDLGKVTLRRPSGRLDLAPQAAGAAAAGAAAAGRKGGAFFLPVADLAVTLACEEGALEVAGRDGGEPFVARQVAATVAVASIHKPVAVQVQMAVGGGLVGAEGKVQSLLDLFKGGVAGEPEKVTLKAVGVELAAFGPLVRHACGEAWVCGGVAEGALTAWVTGPGQVKVEGGLAVDGLTVAGPGQAPSPKADVALLADVAYDRGAVTFSKFELASPWLRANAQGALRQAAQAGRLTGQVTVKAEADLVALGRDFGAALGLAPEFRVQRGRLAGTVEVGADEAAVSVAAEVAASELALTAEGAPLELKPEPSLSLQASFPYGQLPEVRSLRLKAPFAELYGSGRLDGAVVKGSVNLTRLSRDGRRIWKTLPPMVGSAHLDLMTARADGRVAVNGLLKLADVAVEARPGRRLVVSQGALKAEGFVPLGGDGRPAPEVQDATFEVSLEDGRVAGGCKRLAWAEGGGAPTLRGFSVAGDLELGSVRNLLGGLLPEAAQRRLAVWRGRVLANATAEAAGGVVKARLNAAGQQVVAAVSPDAVWRVPDVRLEGALNKAGTNEGLRAEAVLTGSAGWVRDGETLFAENGARVAFDARFAPDYGSVRLESFEARGGLLELQGQADVSELASRVVVSATGRATVDAEALTRLLQAHDCAPFALTGRAAREFRFRAPLAGGGATVFAEGEAAGAAHVASLRGLGLEAGPADVVLRLAQGRLEAAYEPALNGGRLRVRPAVALERGVATVSVPAGTRLLENVRLTQEMADTLLAGVNPLFQGSRVLDGAVTADVGGFRLVAGESSDRGLTAELSLQLTNLRLEMGPTMRELLALLKVKERVYAVERLPLKVAVRAGRVQLEPVRLVVDRQPVIVGGSVGFDGTVSYLIEVPLTDRLTGGVGGALLKGATVKIPVTGTVSEPRLDTAALREAVGGVLRSVAGERAAERVGTFLERLQEELRR